MTDASGDHDGGEVAEAADDQVVARSSIRRNVAQMTSSQVVSWTLATRRVDHRPLATSAPATLGDLQFARAIWEIAAVFTALGTGLYLQLEISRHQRNGLGLVATVFTARTAAFALSGAVIAGYVLVGDLDDRVVALLVLVGITSLLGRWEEVFATSFMGLETMSTVAVVSVAFKLLTLVCTIVVLLAGLGVYGVVGVNIGVGVLSLLAFVWRFPPGGTGRLGRACAPSSGRSCGEASRT